MLTMLDDNMIMELIIGYLRIALLIAGIALVLFFPIQQESTDEAKSEPGD